ncbi:MAG TPA: S24 family peptidase [Burkholderiales bacterium]|nr:S24 family peptidase [Burkholderiales bacterium]
MQKPINIPINPAPTEQLATSSCEDSELVALMVLGDSMEPEFIEGEVLVIETNAPADEGAFVVAEVPEEGFIFRQLIRDEQDGWQLHALNAAYPDIPIPGLKSIKGVVTQKKKPGKRKSVKYYGVGM